MTAKTESPSKLCPSERLARKRAAARLRQQRCRARKRQAMLEERRQQSEKLAAQRNVQGSKRQPVTASSAFRSPYPPVNTIKNDTRVSPSSQPHQIYKCVSFESQRSFEEAMRAQERGSPSAATTPKMRVVSSPPRKIVEIVSTPEDKSDDNSSVPEEEAAAIAAMLSLKTSPTTSKKPTFEIEMEFRSRPQHAPPKIPFYRSWESRHYDKPRGYGLRPRVPEYYTPMSHPHRPSPHYRYYPSFQRYVRYDYE